MVVTVGMKLDGVPFPPCVDVRLSHNIELELHTHISPCCKAGGG